MSDRWTDRLSEYLDGELGREERAELEKHLAGCTGCAGTLEELRGVTEKARLLENWPPEADLWPAIESRLQVSSRPPGAPRPRRVEQSAPRYYTFSTPQLLAACLAVVLLSGSAVWLTLHRASPAPAAPPMARRFPADSTMPGQALVGARYAAAVTELERVLASRRPAMDPATLKVVDANLKLLDHACDQARLAIAADPTDDYLYGHLADTLRRKLELLRRATSITNSQT